LEKGNGSLRARSAAPGGPQGDLEAQNCLPVLHALSKRVTVPAACQETSEQSELPGERYESRVVSFALRCGSATVGRVGGEWPLMAHPLDRRGSSTTGTTLSSVTFMILPHAHPMRDYENEIEASTWCKDKSSIYLN
jgi:hypothetical protein